LKIVIGCAAELDHDIVLPFETAAEEDHVLQWRCRGIHNKKPIPKSGLSDSYNETTDQLGFA